MRLGSILATPLRPIATGENYEQASQLHVPNPHLYSIVRKTHVIDERERANLFFPTGRFFYD